MTSDDRRLPTAWAACIYGCVIAILLLGAMGKIIAKQDAPTKQSAALSEANRCWSPTDKDDKQQVCVPVAVLRVTFPAYTPGQPPPTAEYQQSIHDLQSQIIALRDQVGQLQKALLSVQQGEIDSAYLAAAPAGTKWDKDKHAYVPIK